VFDVPKLN